MGGEESPSLKCPKCGSGNIVGYKGVWECMDCGYKFKSVGSYSNEHKRRPSGNIGIGRGRLIAVLIAVFLLGLYFGYALGTLHPLFTSIISKSSASITQTSSYLSYINPSTPIKSIKEVPPPPGYFKAFEVEVFRIALATVRETYGSKENVTFYEAPYGYKYVVIDGSLTNIGSRTLYFGDLTPLVYLKTSSGKIYEGCFYTKINDEYVSLNSLFFPDQEPGQKIPLIIIFKEVIDTEHPKEVIFRFTIREQDLEYRIHLS